MKKILIVFIVNSLFIYPLTSQSLIQQIQDKYKTLDSVLYIEKTILSFKEDDEKRSKESYEFSLMLRKSELNNTDSIQRKIIIDSLHREYMIDTKNIREERINSFATSLRDKPLLYVLNLRIDSCTNDDNNIVLVPDPSNMPFNLFYFDKGLNLKSFVLFEDGQISHYDSRYRTFSKQIGKNAPKVFKKILRKNPSYLLYCNDLEQMNTILYVLNDKIYVYRIAQMEKFKLGDYIKKFTPSRLNPLR